MKSADKIYEIEQRGGYVDKCTHKDNTACTSYLGKGKDRFCRTTQQKSCNGCRFATIGIAGERQIMTDEVTRLECENYEKTKRIDRQAFSISLLEHDIAEAERRELIALKISRRYKRRKMML